MQALRALGRKAGSSMCRALNTLSEAPVRTGGPGLPLVGLEAFRPATAAAAGIPWWTATAVLQRQPANFSQGLAAAALMQRPVAGSAAVRAPQQSGALTEMWADSVRRKRKRAMNKHKHRKRRKLNRMSSRK